MLRHPHIGRERLVAFQNERLCRLVDHAYRNVAYYRKLFDRHGLKPQDIRTIDDLSAFPITTRHDLQELPLQDILSSGVDPKRLIARSSSGSAGRPLTVRRTWFEERLHNAFRWRALQSQGLRATDMQCYVLLTRTTDPHDHQLVHRMAKMLGVGRYEIVNCFESPENIVQALRRIRPQVVSGYTGVLARIAQQVDRRKLRSLGLRFVGTGGEVLTPLMRTQIQEGFGAPVHEIYASVEFNLLGWQCPVSQAFHVCDDGLILEILRGGTSVAEGERGEVVGTDLHSFAMPLIRYQLGDVVTKGSQTCPCGQPFSTIRSIQGRMIDYFVLPGNKVVHPYEFGVIKAPWIREFQVTQDRAASIVMRVVPFHKPSTRELAELVEPIVKLVGTDIQLQVDLVSEIPMDASGKFRVYRSLVQSAYDGCEWPGSTVKPPLVGEHMEESHCARDVDTKNTR
jgi:phenylacetate-CoA ligase